MADLFSLSFFPELQKTLFQQVEGGLGKQFQLEDEANLGTERARIVRDLSRAAAITSSLSIDFSVRVQ